MSFYTDDQKRIRGPMSSQKQLIEVYENYWKQRDYGSVEAYIDERTKLFSEYGFSTLFLTYVDLENEEITLSKIREWESK